MAKTSDRAAEGNGVRRRSRQASQTRAQSVVITSGNGAYELSVSIAITAKKASSLSHLAEMPPFGAIWPEQPRMSWLARLVEGAQLQGGDNEEDRVHAAAVEMLAAMLESTERQQRRRVRALPRPALRLVGGYERAVG